MTPEHFATLIERERGKYLTVAWRLTRNHDDAEDVLSAAIVYALARIANVRDENPYAVDGWFRLCILHRYIEHRRFACRRPTAISLGEFDQAEYYGFSGASDLESEVIKRLELAELLILLRPQDRALFEDIAGGVSYQELAKDLNLIPGTLRSRVGRLRIKTRKLAAGLA